VPAQKSCRAPELQPRHDTISMLVPALAPWPSCSARAGPSGWPSILDVGTKDLWMQSQGAKSIFVLAKLIGPPFGALFVYFAHKIVCFQKIYF